MAGRHESDRVDTERTVSILGVTGSSHTVSKTVHCESIQFSQHSVGLCRESHGCLPTDVQPVGNKTCLWFQWNKQATLPLQDDITNKCLCCGHKDELSVHVTRCPNPGRQKIFWKTVDSLLDWMENTHSDIKLVECLETYLLAHGEGSMVDIAAPFPHLTRWAMELDILGWYNLLEGRIGREILPLQARSMQRQGSQWHIKSWATEFIHQLLGITHKQWLYHNARTHICLLDGKTESEHNSIMDQVGRFLFTDPSLLLPQHCHLLELDFEKLGTGPTTDRQYWLANLESAVNAFQSTVWPPTSPSLTISPTSTHLGDPTRSATCRIIELS